MPRETQELDPYAPPPRYKEKSGAIVRVALIAAMLGLGAWGYTQFNDPNAPELVAQEPAPQTSQLADGSYDVTPTPAAPATTPTPAPEAAAPSERSAPSAPADEAVPPPSTTIGATPSGR